MPDAAVVVDRDGVIVALNEHAEAMFDYPASSLTGQPIEVLVPERARHRHRSHRAGYLETMQARPMGVGLELAGRRRDGSEFPVDISLAPLTKSVQSLVVAAIRDVTDQKLASAAQAELATIVDSSLDAIISTTLELRVTNWNRAASELLGYAPEEMVGQHVSALLPHGSESALERILDKASAQGHREAIDTRWRRRDGSEVDVAISGSPLHDAGGTLRGFSFIVRDISERKAAENELRLLLAEERRLERQHAATAEIRLALLSDRPLEQSLNLICESGAELVGSAAVAICLEHQGEVKIVAAAGIDPARLGEILPAGESFAERVMGEGKVLELARRSEGSRLALATTVSDGPVLGVPILSRGVVKGALTFLRPEDGQGFSRSDRLFAEGLAAQAVLALERDEARHDREAMMLIGDRERIGRDLHDHVIQRLFAAGLGLQGALSLIGQPRARERVSETIEVLDETIREIRNTIFELTRPPTGLNLVRTSVLALAEEIEEALGFAPSVDFIGPVDAGIAEPTVPHVLAVVREGLANVARHAHASAVTVRIEVADDRLVVAVIDDGQGFGSPSRSSGLANLQERARLLGGELKVLAPPGGGTELLWTVPLRAGRSS